MTPTELIAAFEPLAEAPDGAAQLRELILQLAVSGRLVRQDPKDEPANVLLDRIAMEKARLAKAGKIRQEKRIPQPPEEEPAFSLPTGWEWARCQSVFAVVTDGDHLPPPKSEAGIPFLVIGNVSRGEIDFTNTRFVPSTYYSAIDWSRQPIRGDILYTVTGSFGLAIIVKTDRQFCVQRHIAILKPLVGMSASYLQMALMSPASRAYATAMATGTAQKTLSLSALRAMPLPIPPLAEQHRIVARVEELMGLLDLLDVARAKRETTRAAARDSVLAALREADSPAEVDAAWARFAQRMDDLVCDPADIAPLRQTVLQLAVRGRLVRQSVGDEPADELLTRIAKERARLKRKEREPNSNEVVSLSEASVPFAIPKGWAWSRLGRILIECRNGTSARPNDSGVGYPVLRISACTSRQDASVDLTDFKFAELPEASALPYFVQPGDLLACRYNGNLRYVGRVALVPEGRHQPTLYPDKLIRLRALEVEHGYLRIAINAGSTRKQIESVAATTAGNIGINGKQMQALLVPIPPLAEQGRIIARVNALMCLLDHLELRLATLTRTHRAFAAAAAHNGILS